MKSPSPKVSAPVPIWLGAAAIFFLGLAAYWPAIQGGFIWDDDAMLTSNPLVQARGGLRYIWSSAAPDFVPLTYTSFWLEWHWWRMNPMGYHIVNVLLHAASCVLLWRLLARLKIPGAWPAGALFLLHPVNVESVAWIAQRKNTLSLFFYLAALFAYLRFEQTGRKSFYVFSLLTFLLSLLAKASGLMLPFVLLGLVWWQRGIRDREQGRKGEKNIVGRSWLPLVPFFLLTFLFGLMAMWIQRRALLDEAGPGVDFWTRLAAAGAAVWFYLWKALWPVGLAFVYREWNINSYSPLSYLPGIAVLALLVLLWRFRHSWGRPLLLAFAYFVLLLFPALGFFKIYFQKYSWVADHWQYFALPGVTVLVAAWLSPKPSPSANVGRWILNFGLVAILAGLTVQQTKIYKDSATLWSDTLARNPDCWLALNNFGLLLERAGKTEEATACYEKSLRLKPAQAEGHNNLGFALFNQGRMEEAMSHYQAALKINPKVALTHYNIANVLDRLEKRDEALAEYREALRLNPDYSEAHNNFACLLVQQGDLQTAVDHFRRALDLSPDYPDALNNLGSTLIEQGKPTEAVGYLQAAIQIKADYPEAHFNLGNALLAEGKISDAVAHYSAALKLNPGYLPARSRLGNALLTLGKIDDAMNEYSTVLAQQPDSAEAHYQMAVALVAKKDKPAAAPHFREAIRLKPNWLEPLNSFAWMLATDPKSSFRDGTDAVRFARRAAEITGQRDAGVMDTLAAACAQTEQFGDAMKFSGQALDLARAAGQTNLIVQIQQRQELYRHKTPFYAP